MIQLYKSGTDLVRATLFFYKRRGKPSPRSSHESLHKSQKRTSRIRLLFCFVVSSATPSPGGKPPSPHFNQYSSYCPSVKNRDRPCFFKPLKLTNRFQLRSVPLSGQTHYKKYFHKSWREGVRHRAKRLFLGLPRERQYNSFYTPKNV